MRLQGLRCAYRCVRTASRHFVPEGKGRSAVLGVFLLLGCSMLIRAGDFGTSLRGRRVRPSADPAGFRHGGQLPPGRASRGAEPATTAAPARSTNSHRPLRAGKASVAHASLPLSFAANVGQVEAQAAGQAGGGGWKPGVPGDPVLSYSTYTGTSGEIMSSMAADGSGNTYLAGRSGGLVFVQKLSPDGTTVLYNNVLGSGYNAYVEAIRVDATGKVYITGYAGVGYATTSGAFQQTVTSGTHAFVTVLDATGAILYSSYLAGKTTDEGLGVAVDGSGKVYITGVTYSTNFPTTAGVYQTTLSTYGQSGFVAKFDPAASGAASLLYSTLLSGPTTASTENAIAVDGPGNAYVTGMGGSDFPTTAGAFMYTGTGLGSGGVYVTKLNATATALTYSAYLGLGVANGIAVDGTGDAYVTGSPQIDDFPTTAGAYQTTFPSGFVTELNPAGSTLVYSTFLSGPSGTSSNVTLQDIALPPGCSSNCSAYVAGFTSTTDFPAINPIQNFNASASTSGNDALIVELAGGGASAVYSTDLGGSADESSINGTLHTPGIAVDSTGNTYVSGNTYSTDFPVTLTANPARYSFVAKISPTSAATVVVVPNSLTFTSQPVPVPSTSQTLLVRNMGSATLTITSVTVGGTNSGDFSQTNNCGTSLPGGGSCTLTVTFTPAASGSRAGTITIVHSGNNNPTVINLSGTGADAAFLNLSPSTLNFGDQTVGVATAAQPVTLSNIGDQALTISSFTPSGDFAETNNCPGSLASKANCTVNVAFLPTQEGFRPGSIYVSSNTSYLANATINLAGTGLAGSLGLTASAKGLLFNPQLLNTTSPVQSLTVTNTGNVPVAILSDTATGDFLPAGCVQTLNPGQLCYVRVYFTPTAVGVRSGVVTLTNNTLAGPLTFTVSGTGLAPSTTVSVTPTALDFRDAALGTTTATLQIVVTNTGDTPVIFDRVVESGDFRVTGTSCGSNGLRPTYTCYANVTFTPTALGARTGTIKFVDTATGSPQVVNLSGNGVTVVRSVVVTPATLVFSDQAVTTPSNIQYVTVFNNGNVPISFSSVAASGDFSASYTSCTTVAVASSCSTQVTFTPTATGTRTGTLTFTDDAGAQPVSLSGNGVTATQTLSLTPSSLTFQDQKTSTTGPQQTLIVRNTGTAPVTISSIVASGDLAISYNGCPATLNPSTSCVVNVTFTPTGTGARPGAITLTDTAVGNPQAVNLTGNGVAATPAVTVSPSGLAYDLLVISNTSGAQTVTVTNTTASTVTGLSIPPPSGDYAFSSNGCGTTLSVSASCYLGVTFTPTAAGSRTGAITVTDSAGVQKVNLAGTGATAVKSALLHETSLVFTDRVVNTTSNSQSAIFQNTGNVPVTIATVTLTGADFALSNGCPVSPSTLPPGPSGCNIGVTFTPTGTGARAGSITIMDDAPGSPRTINLSGNGLTAVQSIVLSPPGLVFPTQDIGTASVNTQNIMLTNTGNAPVTISSVMVATGATDYTISYDACTGVLPPGPSGNTCTITVSFKPTAAGTRTGSIKITDTAPGSPLTVTLTGSGVAQAQAVVVSPASVTFNTQVQGTTSSASQTVTVSNTGNFPVTFTSVVVTGDFSIPYNGCTGMLAPGAGSSCQITLSFTPKAAGARTGNLTISDSAPGGKQTVALSGTGIAATQAISLSQTSVSFDEQIVSTPSAPMLVYYYNQGNVAVTIGTVVPSGSDFALTGSTCINGTIVYPSSYCTFRVIFTPAATGLRTGSIIVTDGAPGSPRTITLSGNGTSAGGGANVFPASINFGSQKVTTTSPPQTVTVTNSGNASMTISNVTLSGANMGDFAQSNSCTAVAPGFACLITVTFTPTATGSRAAVLTVTDTGTPTSLMVNLSGTGTPGPVPIVTLSATSLNFNTQTVRTTSPPQSVTLTNTGTGALTISSIAISNPTISGNFVETNTCPISPSTLAPSAFCKITVTFTPTATVDQTATVTIMDNAAGNPHTIGLSGEGVAPEVFLSVSSLSFGSQKVSTTSPPQMVTLTNSGSATLTITSIVATGDFLATNTCAGSVAVGASCTISVTFTPTVTGARVGVVDITDNAGDSPQDIDLTGTGTP